MRACSMTANGIRVSLWSLASGYRWQDIVALFLVSIERRVTAILLRQKRKRCSLTRYRTDIPFLIENRLVIALLRAEFSLGSKNHSFVASSPSPSFEGAFMTMLPNARYRVVRLSESPDESDGIAKKMGGREKITSCGGDCSSSPNFFLSLSLSLSFLDRWNFVQLYDRYVPSSPGADTFAHG